MPWNEPNREFTFVFDLAGVLVEWNTMAVYDGLFRESGKDQSEFFSNILGDPFQNAISAGEPMVPLLDTLARNNPDWADEIHAWSARWDEMLVGSIDGSVSAVGELRERGYRIFILGNWSRDQFERARERFGFLAQFDGVLLSGDCGYLKPDPRIFELAERQFGLQPEKTVFIDDRTDNVQAAISRNWNGVVFENPRQLYLTLMEYRFL